MQGNSAELIKAGIEQIVNNYDFPKDKIKCKFYHICIKAQFNFE